MSLRVLCMGLLLFCFMTGTGQATKSNLTPSFRGLSTSAAHPVYVELGKAELLSLKGDVADVLVADPSVVNVSAVQSNKLYLVGMNVGDTNLIALDAQGNVIKRIDIHVTYDLKAIQAMIGELFPDENVTIRALHDQILLTGKVATPEKASKVANLVANYVNDLQGIDGSIDELVSNLLEVRGEQQVMLQVRILEASRTILKELGVDTNFNDLEDAPPTTFFGVPPFASEFGSDANILSTNALGFAGGPGLALSQDPTGSFAGLFDSGIRGIGQVGVFIDALEDQDLVNVLAEPNLTAVSGQQAGFLAGGEFPVPVGRDQVGNVVVEFRQFGVSLNFSPIVLSEERISLQLNTEVSSLDFESSVALAGLTVPGLDVRRADTTVEVPSGGSLMIAGLLQSETLEGMSGLPGLMNTPVIGDLARSDSFQRNETELVVIVTPYIVKPQAEIERADVKEKGHYNPLARAFKKTVMRSYNVNADVFAQDEQYGYLLD